MIKYKRENAEIGARIKEVRVKRNMTQETLAEKAGICNPQQMSNIERGTAGLSVPRLKDLCKALDVEADYILFGMTNKRAENMLSKYIEKMSSKQLDSLLDFVKAYANTCGIEEE